jgi:hypothetical protein
MAAMMRRFGVALAALRLIAGAVGEAKADLVTYVFSGSIISESGPAPINVGETFSGAISYDDSVPDQYIGPDSDTVGDYHPSLNVQLTIGDSVNYVIENQYSTIQLIDNNITLAPPFVQNVYSAQVSSAYISVDDSVEILIASQTTLPSMPSGPLTSILLQGLVVNLQDAPSFREINFTHSDSINPNNDYVFRGQLDSITATPEPSTLTTAALGIMTVLGGYWWHRRNRRPA